MSVATTDSFSTYTVERRAKLVAAVTALTGSRSVAEDVAQEALLRVWRRGKRFDSADHMYSYAHRTAVRLVIDHWRKHSREDIRSDLPAYHLTEVTDTVEAVLARADALEALASLEALPPEQRAVTVLRVLGVPPAEIATELGVPLLLVKSRLAEGRRTMRARRARSLFPLWPVLAWRLVHRLRIGRTLAPPAATFTVAVAVMAPLALIIGVGERDAAPARSVTVDTLGSPGSRPARTQAREPRPTATPSVHRSEPEVEVEVGTPLPPGSPGTRHCVRGRCGGVGPKPPHHRDTLWVRVPGLDDDLYVYTEPPGSTCEYVLSTRVAGCTPASPSPSRSEP